MSLRNSIERILQRAWYEDASLLSVLLLPFSWIFGWGTALRRFAYKSGWLASHASPLPVLIVGNIAVGGTGKTPLVAWLVARLSEAGYRPGIVSRGYNGKAGRGPLLVDADTSSRISGDEPMLLARRTGAPVVVGSDRVAAVRRLAELGMDIVVADDGLQHYRLRREFEIAVVDAERGLGNGRLLPAGPLREAPARLASVDATVANGAGSALTEFSFELAGSDARALSGLETRPLSSFAGQRVCAMAGIGNPERFYTLLRHHGIVVDAHPLADHATVSLREIRAMNDGAILMTEKDAVKYLDQKVDNAWFVPVDVVFNDDSGDKLMQRVKASIPRAA